MQTIYPKFCILLVDDEVEFLNAASFALEREGITHVEMISDSRLVLPRIEQGDCGVMMLDMTMPYISGRDLLEQVAQDYPEIVIYMITAVNDIAVAVECMKLGAKDYILKPLQHTQFVSAVKRAIEMKALQAETSTLKKYILNDSISHRAAFAPIITNAPVMLNIFKYAEAIAETDVPILITGETGTGKELMAQAIHTISGRTGKLVTVNIAGIDDAIFSDALFGHVRGAFTGADRARKGLIEESAQGTMFLDEIGDLRLESQIKLLRLLQEETYRPVGSDETMKSSCRIIVASNCDLKALVHSGKFRADLFFRLKSHEICLPPLRERFEDIRILSSAFIAEASEKFGNSIPYIHPELLTLLTSYYWPGNIRELKGLLFDMVSRHSGDTLSLKYLKTKISELRSNTGSLIASGIEPNNVATRKIVFPASLPTISDMEIQLIQEALKRTDGNKSQAADILGITRATIINRLREIGNKSE